jgi:hypothetical protein
MALGSTQPLTEMSTKCISWGKGGRCVRLTTLPPSCAVVMKSGNRKFLEPSGPLQASNGTALPLLYKIYFFKNKRSFGIWFMKTVLIPYFNFVYRRICWKIFLINDNEIC